MYIYISKQINKCTNCKSITIRKQFDLIQADYCQPKIEFHSDHPMIEHKHSSANCDEHKKKAYC